MKNQHIIDEKHVCVERERLLVTVCPEGAKWPWVAVLIVVKHSEDLGIWNLLSLLSVCPGQCIYTLNAAYLICKMGTAILTASPWLSWAFSEQYGRSSAQCLAHWPFVTGGNYYHFHPWPAQPKSHPYSHSPPNSLPILYIPYLICASFKITCLG